MSERLSVWSPDGIGEVTPGTDLADLVLRHCALQDGDVVAITSKVVSKAEGRQRRGSREDAIAGETVRVVARRGPTTIVRNRLGLTMAAAGIDASNVEAGHLLLLPENPDDTARSVREAVARDHGPNVAVLVTDTAGRAWREGQTDIAIGAAGLVVLEDHGGRVDAYGNELAVTAPAVADELASAAELATGKLSGRPVSVIRGRSDLVLPPGDHGPGAAALIRGEAGDLFGYGAREAVVRVLAGSGGAVFATPAAREDLATALAAVLAGGVAGRLLDPAGDDVELRVQAEDGEAVHAVRLLATAFGWTTDAGDRDDTTGPGEVRLRPVTP